MRFEEQMLAHAIALVAERHGDAIEETFGTELAVPETPFPRITMAEAQSMLRADGWDPEGVKEDLDPEGERALA
ncbi:aspartate--tRNA(Asn) ligase, partial [Streptomyces sp. SID7499]|nr:aspartate--tRNA(Asn) ligase [Streptomyces sp. SID7499]